MNSVERVKAAISFQRPDRLPRWDNFEIFGEFPSRWRAWKGVAPDADPADYYGIDVSMTSCDEGPFFSQARTLRRDGDYEIQFDSWGRTIRVRPGEAWLMETVETSLDDPMNLDRLEFEDPADDRRYQGYSRGIEKARAAGRMAFTKVGGIYCRSQFMRREDRLLMDMIQDEEFCHALFGRVAEHLTQIALQELRRTDSWETGIWFYDDCANLRAPMFSPAMWEKYLLPLYSKMITTLREAGCRHFYLHSDGNMVPLIPLMLQAGVEGFNPLEPRCMNLLELRQKYGNRFVFFGGACNTRILPQGDPAQVEAMVKTLAELGRDGGLVAGSASIGDDISVEAYDYYIRMLEKHANF